MCDAMHRGWGYWEKQIPKSTDAQLPYSQPPVSADSTFMASTNRGLGHCQCEGLTVSQSGGLNNRMLLSYSSGS